MPRVTVRHFTEADIPIRSELLRDSRFQANLTDFAVSTDGDGLTANQHHTIHAEHDEKRIFTLCWASGEIVGFAWISTIDWRGQRCELSFAVLPRFRGGPGALAVAAAHDYLRAELNMRVIVNQVLEHNTMLQSAQALAEHRQVRCDYDSYTVGEWRSSCYWTFTEDDVARQRAKDQQRRQEIAERVRARTGRVG
jgi:RimJ/RimL family protein N-acetyltransferase